MDKLILVKITLVFTEIINVSFYLEIKMQRYKDIDHDSGVIGYEIGEEYITVWFSGTNKSYTYSYAVAGPTHVGEMKKLAIAGEGLNAYINRFVKFKYDR